MAITPINIDLSELANEFSLVDSQVEDLGSSIIDSVLAEYLTRWNDLVNSELKQSRSEYLKAMVVERTSPTEVRFGLLERESKLALMIEDGSYPFDMKEYFATSGKVKIKKDGGWYLTVPFRHATPGAVAESGIFSSVLTPEVYKAVQVAESNKLKQRDLPPAFSQPNSRPGINVPGLKVPEYVHKSPQYLGLTKVNVSSTPNENRNAYMTFRRVSDKSDPNSWRYPGLLGRKLMDRALDIAQIDVVADRVIDEYLSNI